MTFDIGCPSFSHSYCMNHPIDEGVNETGIITFSDNEYILKVNDGFIEYHTRDDYSGKPHVWRVRLEPDKFGNRFIEIRHPPFTLYDTGLIIV